VQHSAVMASDEPETWLHIVAPGDCVHSLSARYGVHWEEIWHHAGNDDLRQRRANPAVLLPGDIVVVPRNARRPLPLAPKQTNRYRAHVPLVELRLLLQKNSEPRRNLECTFVCEGISRSVHTDGEGKLVLEAPSHARTALLYISENGAHERIDLMIGGLDPADSVSGVQQRLFNLGYAITDPSGSLGQSTRAAIRAFAAAAQITETSEISDDLASALARAHGA
jgi:Putative peptidoglycan binding domain